MRSPETGDAQDGQRTRDFRLYWLAGGIDQLGSHASGVVFALLVLGAGGSAGAAGAVVAAGTVGSIAATPPAGLLADRHDRKRLMVGALLVAAAATGAVLGALVTGLLDAGPLGTGLLVCAAFVGGATSAVFETAAAGTVRRLAPAARYEWAVTRLEIRDQATQIAGPVLGGALYQLGRWVPLLADTVSYLVAAACVAAVRTDLTPRRAAGPGYVAELREGLRFVGGQPFLRFVIGWAAVVNGGLVALSFLAIVVLNGAGTSPATIGLVISAAGVGGLIGALATPAVLRRLRPATVLLVTSWVLPATVAGLAVHRSAVGYGLLFAAACLVCPAAGVVLQARAIAVTPDHVQGRVAAVVGLTGELCQILALVVAGFLASAVPPGPGMLVLAGLFVALAGYATANAHRLSAPVVSR